MEVDRAGRRSERRTFGNGNPDVKCASEVPVRITIEMPEQAMIDFIHGKLLMFIPDVNEHSMEVSTDGNSR